MKVVFAQDQQGKPKTLKQDKIRCILNHTILSPVVDCLNNISLSASAKASHDVL